MSFLIILAVPAVSLILFAALYILFPRISLSKMPPADGAAGKQFKVHSLNGTPYLVTNDLPYSTFFDKSRREKQSLNGEWQFRTDPENRGLSESWFRKESSGTDSGDWEIISVPSVFNASSGERSSYEGFSWYRRTFNRDSVPEGYWSRLCFEGVFLRCEVYLNGHKLCEREGGYTPFYLDASPHINEGDNTLVLRLDNRLSRESLPPLTGNEQNQGLHMYGGIHRDVYFETVPENYIFKAVARLDQKGSVYFLSVDVLIHVTDPTSRIEVTLLDPQGKSCGGTLFNANADFCDRCIPSRKGAVRGGHCDLPLDNPIFWKPGDPQLYTVVVEIICSGHYDCVSFKTGLKTIKIDKEQILFNGEALYHKGISKQEGDPESGFRQSEKSLAEDLDLVKEPGADFILTAHYPHDLRDMLSIRDRGILCSEEIPFCHGGTAVSSLYEEKKSAFRFSAKMFGIHQINPRPLLQNAQKQLIEMIERDINNPAILFWNVGNKCSSLFKEGDRVSHWLGSVAKSIDSSRPVDMAELTYKILSSDNNGKTGKSGSRLQAQGVHFKEQKEQNEKKDI